MNELMKLADEYADRMHGNEWSSYDCDAARDALQSAIEALQSENEKLQAVNQSLCKYSFEVMQANEKLQAERNALAAKLNGQLDELRAVMCGVGVVGKIAGTDVICRESVIDLIDRRRNAAKGGQPTVLKPFTPCVCHDDTAKLYCKNKGKCSNFVSQEGRPA